VVVRRIIAENVSKNDLPGRSSTGGAKNMLLKTKLIRVLFLVGSLFLMSASILACACCVDPGYYEISTTKPDAYILGEFENMKFDTTVDLYEDVAGFDGIRGVDDLAKDEKDGKSFDMNIVEAFLHKTWRLTIKTATGREGTLVLPMPTSMVRFKVDQHDNEPGTETGLYKEFRFKGTVGSATGFLKRGIVRPTSYFLVFQGRGNGCDSSADFSHWRLELDGPKAEYAFYGKLVQP
jgi:hypothetical protein